MNKSVLLIPIFSSLIAGASPSKLPTHPIYYWGKTLLESKNREQRKLAAFKLSQYTQPIYQESVIEALLSCVRDPQLEIKVLCTKALGNVRKKHQTDKIRNALLSQFRNHPVLKRTIINSLIQLKAVDPYLQKALFDEAKATNNPEEIVVLMRYFETFGFGSSNYVNDLIAIYHKFPQTKVRAAILKTLGETAKGHSAAIALLSDCAKITGNNLLQINCLSGLKTQNVRDRRAWQVIEIALETSDLAVLESALELLDNMPPLQNEKLSKRVLAIIAEFKEPEIVEKAVLALGVCGDSSPSTVTILTQLVENKSGDENVRIAAALVLGKQSKSHVAQTKRVLTLCRDSEKTKSLRTACQLGIHDLSAHNTAVVKPAVTPQKAGAGFSRKPAGRTRTPNDKE